MANPRPSLGDVKRFIDTLPNKKKDSAPAVRVEMPEPVLKWRFKIKRDSKGLIDEIVAEALE